MNRPTRLTSNPALRICAIYVAVAGTWILLSDYFLQWLWVDAADITLFQTFKGIAFILVTAVLLYRLIDHYRFSSLPSELTVPRSQKLFPLLVFVALGLAIAASGWYTFSAVRDFIRRDAQQGVSTIGQLKASLIEDWLQQSRTPLGFVATESQMAQILEKWMRSGSGEENLAFVQKRFDTLRKVAGYISISAYDLEGRYRFGSEGATTENGTAAQRVIASGEPMLVGFHQAAQTGEVALGLMVPLVVNGKIAGAIYGALAPADFFESLGRGWPGGGNSTEVLLVQREDQQVLFLNKLRVSGAAALADVLAVDKSLAVPQALAGERGVLQGLSHNGRHVVNFIAEIEGSSWLMVARLDEMETTAAISRLGMISSFTVALLLALSALGAWLWWQRQHAYFLARQEQEALRRQALETNYDALSRFANDMIVITDETGIIVQVNERTLEVYGYAREELINQHVSMLRIDKTRAEFGAELERIRQQQSDRYETQHQRKDNSSFAVEVSAQWIEQSNGNYIHFVLRDISERKLAEKALADENHKNLTLLRTASDGIHILDQKGNVLQASDAFCRMLGYSHDELLTMNVAQFDVQFTTDQLQENLSLWSESPGIIRTFDTRHRCRDGRIIAVEINACYIEIAGKLLMYCSAHDVTRRRRTEQRERSRNEVLELVARGAPLNEILEHIVLAMERENPTMLCSILLMEREGEPLTTVAASSRSDLYHAALPRREVGMGAVPYASADLGGEHVIATGIQSQTGWDAYKTMVAQISMDACWPEPIKSIAGSVLGTLAVYYHEPYTFTEEEIKGFAQEAHLAAIAIERSRANEELQLASQVYQNSSEAMMISGVDGTIITINPAFTKVTGYTLNEVVGKNTRILNSGHHDQAFFKDMWQQLSSTGHWQGEVWNRRKNGEVYPELLTINTIFDADGIPYRFVALFVDITQRKETEQMLWRQTNYDSLTGLLNRHMFHDRLQQEIKKSDRSGLPLALLFLDLDRFKEVNDTLGHDMGDLLLKEAAQRLTGCVRETDPVVRLGGDEFTVILGELDDPGNIERVAQEILRRLAEPYKLGDELAYISASIGITFYPGDADAMDALLKNADQAMYAAKNLGRNRYHYFTPSMQEMAQTRMRLTNDLRRAVTEQQFLLHYQPIVELATGSIHKAEALIRWQHPTRGLVHPVEFIHIAEETGLIIDIGDWVFHEAAVQVARWRDMYAVDFEVSINKSPIQFHADEESHLSWFEHLRELNLPGQSIVVEITEGLLLDASSAVSDKLLAFRDAGIQVSLDDFGTGYSSLSYLKKFDIDYLKIDQSFVYNLENDANNRALCEAIIMMAHKLGMKVIAEGVETVAQRDLLAAFGCDFGQGFLFSIPLPTAEFDRLLKTWNVGRIRMEKSDWSI